MEKEINYYVIIDLEREWAINCIIPYTVYCAMFTTTKSRIISMEKEQSQHVLEDIIISTPSKFFIQSRVGRNGPGTINRYQLIIPVPIACELVGNIQAHCTALYVIVQWCSPR